MTTEEWHKLHPYVRYGRLSWGMWTDYSGDFDFYIEQSQSNEISIPFPKVYLYERELDKLYVDEILDLRNYAREYKNFELSDIIRNYLDKRNIFIFDTPEDSEVYYLTEDYFKDMSKIGELYNIKFKSRRKFVEWKIKQDIKAENNFNAWLFSLNESIKKEQKEKKTIKKKKK